MAGRYRQDTKGQGKELNDRGLQEALECLSRQAKELAHANAHAAELMAQLEQANDALQQEIAARKAAEQELIQLNAQIDAKVRQQTEELAAAKKRLDTIFDAILTGVFIVDAQTHAIVDANPLAIKMVGLPREEVIGRICHKFVCPAEQGRCPITDLGQTVDCSERVFLRADGTQVPIIKTVTPTSWHGRQYLVESFLDITDRKQSEQRQAELIEQLSKANRQLAEFAYVVSHDLKAPLRGIKVLSDWIARDYGQRLGPEGCRQLELLASRVDRMQALIDGILQYSKLDRQQAQDEQVDLNSLVAEVIDLLAPPGHIEVKVEGPLPTVIADKTRISQVFQNLISNAIRYMDKPQGKVVIWCKDEGDFWRLVVSDNGPGIEARYFEKIFQLFQTLSSRDDKGGTGIGLAVVKKVVQQYGGRVWVESEVGKGSTFFFTFPKAH